MPSASDLKNAQYNVQRPDALSFNDLNANNTQVLDENGNVRDQYKLGFDSIMPQVNQQMGNIDFSTEGLQALRQKALQQGPSPWLQLQQQQLGNQLSQSKDDASSQNASANANAMSQLARSGGLSSGASERTAKSGAQSLNQQQQQIARQGITSGLDLQIQDENNKNALLSALPGQEAQAFAPQFQMANANLGQLGKEQALQMQADQSNIGTGLNELTQKRAFDLDQYQEKMKAWAADRTAQAQENAGKK